MNTAFITNEYSACCKDVGRGLCTRDEVHCGRSERNDGKRSRMCVPTWAVRLRLTPWTRRAVMGPAPSRGVLKMRIVDRVRIRSVTP